jgi:hypothetical protein
MDKWTRGFLDEGFSSEFKEVISIVENNKALNKWANDHSDGMFGPIFALSQVEESFKRRPSLICLPPSEIEMYRKFNAAALVTNEFIIPVLYLSFRDWYSGIGQVDVKKLIRMYGDPEEWNRGIAIAGLVDLSRYATLDEPSKLLIYVMAKQGGKISVKDLPIRRLESFKFLNKPTLDENVLYALEDMKSSDIALYLKSISQKQVGTKKERIQRLLNSLTTEEIAANLKITENSYLHLLDDVNERANLCDTAIFFHDLTWSVIRLNSNINLHVINNNSYKAAGVTKVQYLAILDDRTDPICRADHNKIYDIDIAPKLPHVSNCNCTTVAVFED